MAGKKDGLHDAKKDAQLVSNMVMGNIFHGDGVNQLMSVVKGAGPNVPMAVAHALYINIANARNQLMKNSLPVDGRIWTSKGGVVDRVVDDTGNLIASNFGPQFASPKFKGATRNALMQVMHEDETSQGGPGMPAEPTAPEEAASPEEGGQDMPSGPAGLVAPGGGE